MNPLLLSFAIITTTSAANAAPIATFSPDNSAGIEIISCNDGQYKAGVIQSRPAVSLSKDCWYLYFKLAPEIRGKFGKEAYIVVDYLDKGFNNIALEYNSISDPYEHGPSFTTTGTGKWDRYMLHINRANFGGRQSTGADFRLRIFGSISISRIEIYTERPDIKLASDAQRYKNACESIKHLPCNPPPAKMSYVIGDPFETTEPWSRRDLRFGHCADDITARLCKSLGITSFENYVTWETVEGKGEGEWDWSMWDRQVRVLKAHKMKWVPFVILGPAYSTPNWFRASKDHIPCRCLEHGTDSKIESLWNPNLPKWIDRFIHEFANRYRDSDVIDCVLLGIQGDYGEAIYSASGGWTEAIPGAYHSHAGFWCDDLYALADFRKFIRIRYKTIDAVNAKWGTKFPSLDAVDYPGRGDALIAFREELPEGSPQARRQWLDFIDWYRDSMTRWEDLWMSIARKHFPHTPIYLCTGGEGQPEHGSNFAEQCRIAAKYHGGVRVTNEGSGYCWNYVITNWAASAGRYYGAEFGFEPAAYEDESGVIARIYNATTSGANELHDYTTNLLRYQSMMDAQRKNIKYLFHVAKPIKPVALWYPNVFLTLKWGNFWDKAAAFRDYIDYDYVDETMLRAGALSRNKILVILHGEIIETADAERIAEWIRKGGRLVIMGVQHFESVEATPEPDKIFLANDLKDRVVWVSDWNVLANQLKILCNELNLPVYDLRKDGIYVTQIAPDKFLFLNTNEQDSQVEISWREQSIVQTVPKGSISLQQLGSQTTKPD